MRNLTQREPNADYAGQIDRATRAREAARSCYYDAMENLHLNMRAEGKRRVTREYLTRANQARDELLDRCVEVQRLKASAFDRLHFDSEETT